VGTVRDVMCGDGVRCKKHAPLVVHIAAAACCSVIGEETVTRVNGLAGRSACCGVTIGNR
jgi:hypothetical protein